SRINRPIGQRMNTNMTVSSTRELNHPSAWPIRAHTADTPDNALGLTSAATIRIPAIAPRTSARVGWWRQTDNTASTASTPPTVRPNDRWLGCGGGARYTDPSDRQRCGAGDAVVATVIARSGDRP